MPECRECLASALVCTHFFDPILSALGPLPLVRIDIDATDKEASKFSKAHPASKGLPYTIDSTCTAQRGVHRAQTSVFPEMYRTSKNQNPIPLPPGLVLKGFDRTDRALIVDLGPLFLMIQYLTHTSPHPMPRSVYENSILRVDKKVRAFQVGMALVFQDYVLAFHSIDLVFQPTWAYLRTDLPCAPMDPCAPDWQFPSELVAWMRSRVASSSKRNGLACDVIRDCKTAFMGIGVYTVVEVFFLAGLSPFLTEAEVFDNPSRVARLCGAYMTYLDKSTQDLWKLLSPAMKDGVLAPTNEHRLRYLAWLHVYAKDYANIPVRMGNLVKDYHTQINLWTVLSEERVRSETTELFDVFEPTYLSKPLSLDHNLGHLIFGNDIWLDLGGKMSDRLDPITQYFAERDLLHRSTFLRTEYYYPLLLPKKTPMVHCTVFAYKADKQIWSITERPCNSRGVLAHADSPTSVPVLIAVDQRRTMLFSHIVQRTHSVAIGPLEYCGLAHRISVGRSTQVIACYGAPTVSEYYQVRDLKSRLLPAPTHGRRRPSLIGSSTKKLQGQITSAKRAREEEEKENDAQAPATVKRTRMSVDKKIVWAEESGPKPKRPRLNLAKGSM